MKVNVGYVKFHENKRMQLALHHSVWDRETFACVYNCSLMSTHPMHVSISVYYYKRCSVVQCVVSHVNLLYVAFSVLELISMLPR